MHVSMTMIFLSRLEWRLSSLNFVSNNLPRRDCIYTCCPVKSRKYLRVSEMLIMDTMTYLLSETPIHIRPPVNQSQLQNRESLPGENTSPVTPRAGTHEGVTSNTSLQPGDPMPQASLASPVRPVHTYGQSQSPPTAAPPATYFTVPTSSHYLQPTLPSQRFEVSLELRITASFGYNTQTPENIAPLSHVIAERAGQTIGSIPPFTNKRLHRYNPISPPNPPDQ
jgi:hypothetical protein